MLDASLGELFSLAAVLGWTVSALSFESAGKRIGSVPVNIIRLAMAVVFLAVINVFRGMPPWPAGVNTLNFLWLLASGFVGFFLGDLLLFRSYLIIGSRLAMLVMSLSPPISALLDRLVFGVRLAPWDFLGILLTMSGVALAVTTPNRPPSPENPVDGETEPATEPQKNRTLTSARWLGFLLAFGGAAGQSGGMILGKLGMSGYDPLSATFVRTLGGMAGFIPLVLISGAARRVLEGIKDKKAMTGMSLGAVAGPVLGVSAVLMAMRYSPAGVVSAITAIVPVVIILPSVIFLGDKVRIREVIGAFVAVAGVVVLIIT